MEYLSESNYYKEIMPIHAAYYDTDAPYPHWHPATELFFVLSGEAQVTVEEETFTVQEEDIFLINANDVHLIEGADCKMLSLRFQIDKLPYFNTARIPRFALCSSGNTHAPALRLCALSDGTVCQNERRWRTYLTRRSALFSRSTAT